jgi:hypothetical protein
LRRSGDVRLRLLPVSPAGDNLSYAVGRLRQQFFALKNFFGLMGSKSINPQIR